jgi:hypothetical protein
MSAREIRRASQINRSTESASRGDRGTGVVPVVALAVFRTMDPPGAATDLKSVTASRSRVVRPCQRVLAPTLVVTRNVREDQKK